jgi:hypothetical protein
MQKNNHFKDVSEFLASCVDKIKMNYPRFSNLQIAKKLGIPNSTFDRISKKEVEAPSFTYALKIAQEACNNDDLQSFIKKYFPQMFEDFVAVYPGNKDVPFVSPDAEEYFQDPSTIELMIMATTHAGICRNKTATEFGNRGLAILDKLIGDGILKEDGNKIFLGGPVNAKQDTVQKVLQNLINLNYDLDSFGDHLNWLTVQYESVNAEVVIPKLREIYIETNQKIRNIFRDPNSIGKDVVWAGLVMDTLSKHSNLDFNAKSNNQERTLQ